MKRLLVSVGAAALLLGGVGAQAKLPPEGVEFCGVDACTRLTASEAHQILFRAGVALPPARPAPFYVLRWSWSDGEQFTAYWLPGAKVIRRTADKTVVWERVVGSLAEPLERAAVGLRPFQPLAPDRVFVGGRRVSNPQSYLRLFAMGTEVDQWRGARGWIRVRIESDRPSPWTDGAVYVAISRAGGFVLRDWAVYRIPAALAERVRRGSSLR